MREYNKQASDYIFRENNQFGRVESDCIDLHGQFVDEAEAILERRIRADIAAGQPHLHAIVGKGNHSSGHVQRIKPKVEELCGEMGLRFETEENEGRIFIDLTGGRGGGGGAGSSSRPPKQQYQQPQQPQKPLFEPQRPHYKPQRPPQQQHQQQTSLQQEDEDLLSKVFRKVREACCILM
jgi:hypothetical protein